MNKKNKNKLNIDRYFWVALANISIWWILTLAFAGFLGWTLSYKLSFWFDLFKNQKIGVVIFGSFVYFLTACFCLYMAFANFRFHSKYISLKEEKQKGERK